MSDLNAALEGLRQAKKQLQWVNFAEDAIKALQAAKNDHDILKQEVAKLKEEHTKATADCKKADAKVKELHEAEHAAAKSFNEVQAQLLKVEAEVVAKFDSLQAEANKRHAEALAALEAEFVKAKKAHDVKLGQLAKDIEEALVKKADIQNDIDKLTSKWSK